ncbi:MarR family transcriptional regulator [Leifsonia sp. H3M29-4]|uniref:MarR family winged helix-turn-helix transcriptional regulator n=1 Tax=Salinibacterium metalliresistens TaxID=3031321 RepID=UPI0023DAF7BC|nr:MarR family transcriptional regulator [Salinibacterium metalliresistens]MDF1479329.1 MarR family transcriptional regulator [Salinibacterium metalliresistens]
MANQPLPWDPIAEAHRQWRQHGWGAAADGMAVVTSIMRAEQLMLGRVQAILKPLGLSFARYEMLRLLSFAREGGMPMASATRRLQVHPTSVTNTVDRLEADGLVVRTAHPNDGRATIIRVTEAGRDVAERATVLLNSFFERPGLNDADVGELVRILAKFRQDAGDFDPVNPPEPLG